MSEPPPPAAPFSGLPLEEPGRPFLPALFDTLKLLIVDPKDAFARMSPTADLTRPVLYALVLGLLGVVVEFAWSFVVQGSILGILSRTVGTEALLPSMILGLAGGVLSLLLAPVFVLVGIFLWTAVIHVFLAILGGANRGFGATLRVVCYAQSTRIAVLVPVVGGLISTVWGLALCILGVSAAHNTSLGRAAAAVLLPLVLCCAGASAILLLLLTSAALR